MTMRFGEIFKKGLLIGVLIYAMGMIAGVIGIFVLSRNLPTIKMIQEYRPPASTQVIARDGTIIAQFYVQRREPIHLLQVPPHVRNAFIANEDRRFYSHHGIDPIRIVKVVLVNLVTMSRAQGASTITQQLARNMFLTPKKTIIRKIKEILLSIRLERVFSKDEILERYLNQIYFGHGVYGIQAASKFFFGKDVSELTPAEAALLAGIPKNPSIYSPLRHKDLALKRKNLILRLMYLQHFIDEKTYREGLSDTLRILKTTEWGTSLGIAPYFLDMVRGYILRKYGEDFLYKSGGQIYTTLDPALQQIAEDVIDSVLTELEERWDLSPKYVDVKKEDTIPKPMTRYLQGALVAMDPRTGEILAIVGGRDYKDSKFNRATQAKRQPGSAFKPFIYSAAIESGYTPASIVYDIPLAIRDPDETKSWYPVNFDNKFLGPITLRKALALSRNLATARLGLDLGPRLIADYVHRLGIKSRILPVPSIALGSPSVTLLEMVNAYATFANYGIRVNPFYIRKVMDNTGGVLEVNRPDFKRVLDDVSAYLVTSLLQSVVNEGTGLGIRLYYGIKFPVAGKTGTTNDFRDAWFIGYTTDLVVGVWVGYDSLRTISKNATGARMAIPVWANFIKRTYKLRPQPQDFRVPPGIDYETICEETGLLATQYCPKTRLEVFREGTAPIYQCFLHGPGVAQDSLFWKKELEFLISQ